ncbi:MAG: PLP-dependent transferase [Bacteroidales bacterium]|nr:PLP-dependent transferase [Bacteroidales bacterium]
MDISEIINLEGETHSSYFNAVAPPIIQTSNFCFNTVEDMRKAIAGEFETPVYSRGNNPTLAILRKKLAALEHAEDCLVTASGCAAISSAALAFLKSGDHVVCMDKPYSWTRHLFSVILPRFGIETTYTDGRDAAKINAAVRKNTRLLYLESPNSWTFELQDLKEAAAIAKRFNLVTVADNSYCTPLLQNPLDFGIDLVVHSASKYLSGHSDVVAGVVCGKRELIKKIFENEYMTLGGIIAPFDAWLMLRGLRTLEVRLEKSSANAAIIADFLAGHEKVQGILYPGHPSFPQFELARRQMKGSSGLLTVVMKTADPGKVEKFCESLKYFRLAVSWGGYESLVMPAIGTYDPSEGTNGRLPVNMVRFYTGLENAEELIRDLERGLESV